MDSDRPISPICAALLHSLANGDAAMLTRLRHFILDASDMLADRWMMFRLAERDAWKTVELYLLQRLIERRFREGELDAWVELTPFGEDLQQALEREFEQHGSFDWPAEPQSFDVAACLELRAARLAGELYAERLGYDEVVADPIDGSLEIQKRFAAALREEFPLLAQVVMHEDLDVVALTWNYLTFRLRANEEMRGDFGPIGEAIIDRSMSPISDLAMHFYNWPEMVEELIGDVLADSALRQRRRLEAAHERLRRPLLPEEAAELKRQARAEVQTILSQSVPIQAETLAEAFAEAERLKASENVLMAQNSLWSWFCALSPDQQAAIGIVEEGKYAKVRFYSKVSVRMKSKKS